MGYPATRLALTALTASTQPAAAATTHFHIKPIVISGAVVTYATAINKKGAITGTYYDANNNSYSFVLDHGTLTYLASDCHGTQAPCNPKPDAISDSGAVAGHYVAGTATYSFLWQNGTYVSAGNVWMGNDYTQSMNPLGINKKGEEFYNLEPGEGQYGYIPYAGFPGEYEEILPDGGFLAYASSISNDGSVAGEEIDNDDQVVAFIARDSHVKFLAGPYGNGVGSSGFGGIYINDEHQLAGLSESTKTYSLTGWIYSQGSYATFDLPSRKKNTYVDVAALQGINNNGRVIGSYTDPSDNTQRAFLYNGTTLSVFGKYPSSTALQMGISDDGTILLSYTGNSYRVVCHGTGC
jgi:probable HAF family extracellular repeat protein